MDIDEAFERRKTALHHAVATVGTTVIVDGKPDRPKPDDVVSAAESYERFLDGQSRIVPEPEDIGPTSTIQAVAWVEHGLDAGVQIWWGHAPNEAIDLLGRLLHEGVAELRYGPYDIPARLLEPSTHVQDVTAWLRRNADLL